MFAVLVVKPSGRRGIAGALLDRLMRRRTEIKHKTAMGIRFEELTAYEMKRGLDWKEIERLSGPLCGNLVMPRALKPPDKIFVRPFTSSLRFYCHLVRNTAVDVIRRSEVQLYRRTVGVVDPEAVYQQTVLELIRYCSSVHVLTENVQRYGSFCEQVMDTYGAPVLASDDPQCLQNCILVVAPGGITASAAEGLTAPVISAADTERPVACPVICDLHALLPEPLAEIIPGDIHPTDFSGAFFEMGGVKELSYVVADGGRCKGRTVSAAEIAAAIAGRSHSLH